MIRREEKLIPCSKYYYIRAFGLAIINVTLFLSLWTMKHFLSVILQSGCNEIESNIVNCRMSHGERSMDNVKIKTQNGKIVETDTNIWY